MIGEAVRAGFDSMIARLRVPIERGGGGAILVLCIYLLATAHSRAKNDLSSRAKLCYTPLMAAPLDTRKRNEIEAYIVDNANDPEVTVVSTALAFNVSEWTVSDIRRFLREVGRIGVFPRTAEKHRDVVKKTQSKSPVSSAAAEKNDSNRRLLDSVTRILEGEVPKEITPEQRRQILDQTIVFGSIDQKQKAIREREAIDRQSGQVQEIGPGSPLTEEDWIRELSLILEASGLPLAEKAWTRAFHSIPSDAPPHIGGVAQDNQSQTQTEKRRK